MRFAFVLAALALMLAGNARADERSGCAESYQSAQRLRMAGRLREARKQLLVCAQPACPAFITSDCTGWLAEVEGLLPSVVLSAVDEHGADLLADAEIRIDGEPAEHATDGLPNPLDPGVHTFELKAHGQTVRQQIVVKTGERARRVELRLPPAAPPEAAQLVTRRPIPASALIFTGLAVALAAGGTVLWIVGSNDASAYNARCSTSCTSSERDSVLRELVVGDALWAAAIVSVGVGAVLFFTRPTRSQTLAIQPGLRRDGLTLSVTATF